MKVKITLILLLLVTVASSMKAGRPKRIDREIQNSMFIPKGQWMFGGTVSYSEHDESNLNFLVLKDVEGVDTLSK